MTDQPALDPKEELIELRKQLHAWRSAQEQLRQGKKTLLDAVTNSSEYKALDEAEQNAKKNVEYFDAELRREASLFFQLDADRNKHPIPGVDIREVTKVDYEKKTAFAYAVRHLMFLELDTKAFEKHAKEQWGNTEELDFVNIKIELSATIATDLSKYD